MAMATIAPTSTAVVGGGLTLGKLSRDSKRQKFSVTSTPSHRNACRCLCFHRNGLTSSPSSSLWLSSRSNAVGSPRGSIAKVEEGAAVLGVLSAKRLVVSLGATLAVLLSGLSEARSSSLCTNSSPLKCTCSEGAFSSSSGSIAKVEEGAAVLGVLSAKRLVVSLGATLAVLLSGVSEAVLAEGFNTNGNEMCQVAASGLSLEAAMQDASLKGESVGPAPGSEMMMRGMTAKNFDPIRYAGRWYEVASLKKGFAGQGQEDCHCTQGVYTVDIAKKAIQVDTFCVHGSPDGYITGIRGKVQCVAELALETSETDLERKEMVKEKCYLRFPTLPFIPKEPYDVIDTDYDTFALVSGARDTSFVQIYSRTPNPGKSFIEKYKAVLANYGYNADEIVDTPQDCPETSMMELEKMMSPRAVRDSMTNTLPIITNEQVKSIKEDSLSLGGSLRLPEMKGMLIETFKKLFELYRRD